MTYAITGSTGNFGSLALRGLLGLGVQAKDIVAIARNEAKTASLFAKGVSVRIADYGRPETLESALAGVDRLLLVSGSEVGKRSEQHRNVIAAAKKTGVKFIVYTSLTRAAESKNPLAPEHKATEEALAASGIPYAVLRNNWYTENYLDDVKRAGTTGVIEAAAGNGVVHSASRSDYAEAAVRVLAGEGHAGKTYELSGEGWNYATLAKTASEILGRTVSYKAVSAEQRQADLAGAGLPPEIAGFVTALDAAIAAGTLDNESRDLEMLLGRKPLSLKEGLKAALG
ncbi:MAG: SDR family oxidoreductase [Treponemataceae bacterium]